MEKKKRPQPSVPTAKKKTAAGKTIKKTDKTKFSVMKLSKGFGGKASVTRVKKKKHKHAAFRMSDINRVVRGDLQLKVEKAFLRRTAFIHNIKFSAYIVASVLILAAIVIFFSNRSLSLDERTVSIAGLNSSLEGYKILLISDMNGQDFGDDQVTITRALNRKTYDLVLFAGDMVGGSGDYAPFISLIENLKRSVPKYFVAGDSDPGPYLDEPRADASGEIKNFVLEDWILAAEDAGAVYLSAPTCLTVGNASLWLSPETLLETEASPLVSKLSNENRIETAEYVAGSAAAAKALPFTAYRLDQAQSILSATTTMQPDDMHIALAHYPPLNEYNPNSAFATSGMLRMPDLVVAGHFCGGGWRLPLYGALYIPATEASNNGWFPKDQSVVEGLRMLGPVSVYTTGGLSISDAFLLPKLRLNNRPKITLLTLTAALTDDLLGVSG